MNSSDTLISVNGNRPVAFLAVAALHMAAVYALYAGLLTRVTVHVPAIFQLVATQQPDRANPRPVPPTPTVALPALFVPEPEYRFADPDTDLSNRVDVASVPPVPDDRGTPGIHSYSAASFDPAHPFKVGEDYYPPGAVRLGQEGRCGVQVTVTPDGRITSASLARSTGFPLLDAACLTAVNGQRMRPATQDGKSVESQAIVPIVWKLYFHP